MWQGGVNSFLEGPDYSKNEDIEDKNVWVNRVPNTMHGWNGYGGSLHVWDNDLEIGFAYVPTYLAWYDQKRQNATKILDKLYKCLIRSQ